jgi:hypothetical protein
MTDLPSVAESSTCDRLRDPLVLGWLDRRNFEEAKRRAPAFAAWSDYGEFVAERDLLNIGYGWAGVAAEIQRVSFQGFERWSRLTGASLDIDSLDEFAAHWRWRRAHPDAPVIGRFGAPDNPERHAVAAANVQCLRIRPEVFVRWRDDFANGGLFAAPDLDCYAAHVVELCLSSESRARRPAVNSS